MNNPLDSSFSVVPLIASTINALHTHSIEYCQWKSNSRHMLRTFSGESDVDILIDKEQKERAEELFISLGFKFFKVVKERSITDVVDFLGLDDTSGKLIHLHIHYRIPLGKPFLKEYKLDLESLMLQNRIFDEGYGTYCISPSFQLILLYYSEALRYGMRDRILLILNQRDLKERVLLEYQWLTERSEKAEINQLLNRISAKSQELNQLLEKKIDKKQVLQFRSIIRREVDKKRTYSYLRGLSLRWSREARHILHKGISSWFDYSIPTRRINPRGGVAVAVIGADGSGKSTITTQLQQVFGEKIDTRRIYFGRGDGRVSFSRKVLLLMKGILQRKKSDSRTAKSGVKTGRKRGFIHSAYKSMEALFVALEKKRNLKLLVKLRRNGILAICDRYPQNQIMGYNDGPLLHHFQNSANPVFKWISRFELKIYKEAENHPPDVLIKLIAEAEVVERRKPGETALDKLEAKITGIKKITFGQHCRVVTIDASQPLQHVLSSVKNEIWKVM